MGKIDQIDDEKLNKLIKKISVLRKDQSGNWRKQIIPKEHSPRTTSFTWVMKPSCFKLRRKLKLIGQYKCLHSYGYHGFFKPSLAEVFAQMPLELVDKALGFTIEAGDTWCALTEDQKHQWSTISVYGEDK